MRTILQGSARKSLSVRGQTTDRHGGETALPECRSAPRLGPRSGRCQCSICSNSCPYRAQPCRRCDQPRSWLARACFGCLSSVFFWIYAPRQIVVALALDRYGAGRAVLSAILLGPGGNSAVCSGLLPLGMERPVRSPGRSMLQHRLPRPRRRCHAAGRVERGRDIRQRNREGRTTAKMRAVGKLPLVWKNPACGVRALRRGPDTRSRFACDRRPCGARFAAWQMPFPVRPT